MNKFVTEKHYDTFGDFILAKRREREIPSMQVCDKVGISPGYYCDIERSRRNPPDREILERLALALYLTGDDLSTFYDLAGLARSEAPPDLPEYINEYQVVRVALRLAKDRGCVDDWHRLIRDLESRPTVGG